MEETKIELAESQPEEYVGKALNIFNQIVHVLAYYMRYEPKWAHNDIHLKNLIIVPGLGPNDGDHVRVIDFGRANSSTGIDPDWKLHGSLDVHRAALVLDELITGEKWTYRNFVYHFLEKNNTRDVSTIVQKLQSDERKPKNKYHSSMPKKPAWGSGSDESWRARVHELEPMMEKIVYGDDGVAPGYRRAATHFWKTIRNNNWHSTFLRMLSGHDRLRPTAADILDTEFMKAMPSLQPVPSIVAID